jgi:hypothetical protein
VTGDRNNDGIAIEGSGDSGGGVVAHGVNTAPLPR